MSDEEATPPRPNEREGSEELTGDMGTAVTAEFDAPATAAADAVVENRPALSPGSALLVVTRGPNTGSRFALTQPVMSAGRHPESDIYLDDITVSRRHAEFLSEGGEFRIVDVGSMNHTYLNREAVDSAVLTDGDEIQLGRVRLLFLANA